MILSVARARPYEPGLNLRGEQEPQPWLFLLPSLEVVRALVVGRAPRGTHVALSSLGAVVEERASLHSGVGPPPDLVYVGAGAARSVVRDRSAMAALRRLLEEGAGVYVARSGRRARVVERLARALGVTTSVRLARVGTGLRALDVPRGPSAWLLPVPATRPAPKAIRGARRLARRALRRRPAGVDEPLLAPSSTVSGVAPIEPEDGLLVLSGPLASGLLPRYLLEVARASGHDLEGHGWTLTPPRGFRSQKVVFQLPELELIVKVTQDSRFNRSLRAEYDALVALEPWTTTRPGVAPRPLFVGEHAGLLVVGESRLVGAPFHRRSDGTATCPVARATLEALLELASVRCRPVSGAEAAEALAELLASYMRVCTPPTPQVRLLEKQVEVIAASGLATVFSHGDPTTHNVLVDEGGRVGLVDWENAEPAGMPLWDLLRFTSAYAARSAALAGRRWTPALARAYLFESSPFQRLLAEWIGRARAAAGVPAELVEPLLVTCLAVDALRQATRLPVDESSRSHAARLLALLTRDGVDPGLRALAGPGS